MPRCKTQIIAEILRIARNGACKTRIVYRANLNAQMLRGYAERLSKEGLIREEGREMKTTEKGREYLEQYYNLKRVGGDIIG